MKSLLILKIAATLLLYSSFCSASGSRDTFPERLVVKGDTVTCFNSAQVGGIANYIQKLEVKNSELNATDAALQSCLRVTSNADQQISRHIQIDAQKNTLIKLKEKELQQCKSQLVFKDEQISNLEKKNNRRRTGLITLGAVAGVATIAVVIVGLIKK